ncbi:methyltransferase [Flavobacterium cyanobacteriorum]|uniref:Methyltransferase n=1 Tax=Flavobacterium cyanobacteriorum TaxID=2022802 RepID=A0A256A5P5_9FLAO|nr:methyltransferase domain-containing protein [Flavobacterium cyanobacteriorum]OYQ48474.1 methyltransferase [Flavobacterium cyanobacteriorum]
MEVTRKPLQGVTNIARFNWHFYLIAFIAFTLAFLFQSSIPGQFRIYVFSASVVALLTMIISLLVSYYVYDFSNLYSLSWLPNSEFKKVLNINAGFDETSQFIKGKFPKCELTICDFYDKEKHTEVSIKRARSAYPPLIGTIEVSTNKLPFKDNEFEYCLAILSAHEIRDKSERVQFFNELKRVTKPNGQIFVTEHLRDFNNFLAYTIGSFHFYSKSTWKETFKLANLSVEREIKTTPFITTFILNDNGNGDTL